MVTVRSGKHDGSRNRSVRDGCFQSSGLPLRKRRWRQEDLLEEDHVTAARFGARLSDKCGWDPEASRTLMLMKGFGHGRKKIPPGPRPPQFACLVVLLRATPPLAFPSTTELPPVSIIPDPVNPKGIAYHHLNKTLIVALARNADINGQKTSCLKEVNAFTGNRAVWAGTFRMYRGVESKIAIV